MFLLLSSFLHTVPGGRWRGLKLTPEPSHVSVLCASGPTQTNLDNEYLKLPMAEKMIGGHHHSLVAPSRSIGDDQHHQSSVRPAKGIQIHLFHSRFCSTHNGVSEPLTTKAYRITSDVFPRCISKITSKTFRNSRDERAKCIKSS
jgi:hypothetical protein